MTITKKLSPNYTEGRENTTIDRIVIHWIAEGTADSAATYFSKTTSKVSAHYIVGNSIVYQCVTEGDTAWHAGEWEMNQRSIGIEHEARPDLPMTEDVYQKSAELIKTICARYNIPIDREHIIKHSEVKATACPGIIDIDKLILLAKGDGMTCEEKLDEMRISRNSWKQKCSELEEKVELERDEHAEEVKAKQKIIDDQQVLIAGSQSDLIGLRKMYNDMKQGLDDSKKLVDKIYEQIKL